MKIAYSFHFNVTEIRLLSDSYKIYDENAAILPTKCNFARFDQVCARDYRLLTGRNKKIIGGIQMIQHIGNKLQVEIDTGSEKAKKISFSNVIDNPSEEKVMELGEIMKELSVEGSELNGIVLTTQSRYTK